MQSTVIWNSELLIRQLAIFGFDEQLIPVQGKRPRKDYFLDICKLMFILNLLTSISVSTDKELICDGRVAYT